jgi:hypothetical protein
MKPDRTTYFFIAPHPIYGTFAPIKMATEYPLGEDDLQEDAWDDAKQRAEAWAAKNFPALDREAARMLSYGQAGSAKEIIQQKTPEDQRVAALIADIYSCTELKTLESYRIMAKAKPELLAAYEQQYEKLSK